MKKIIVLVVLIAALGSPYLIGRSIENQMETFALSFEEVPAYQITLDSYESGYLSSTAYLRVALDSSFLPGDINAEEAQALQALLSMYTDGLLLKVDFSHGPFAKSENQQIFGMFIASISLAETPDVIQAFKDENNIATLLNTEILMSFSGKGELTMSSPSFEMDDGDNSVNYGGFDVSANLQGWGATYEANGEFYESVFTSRSGSTTVTMLPLTYHASGDLSQGFMFATGDGELTFSGLRMVGPVNMVMDNLTMTYVVTAPTDETITIDYHIALENLNSDLMAYPLEGTVLDFSFSNLQRQALLNYYEMISNAGAQQDPIQAQQDVMASLGEMFSGGAEYRINELGFEYGSDIQFSLAAGLSMKDEASAILANPAAMQNPFLLIGYINADLDLELSEGFLNFAIDTYLQNQAPALRAAGLQEDDIVQAFEQQKAQYLLMVSQFTQSGILTTSAGSYSMSAVFADGALEVNGVPYPLPF